LVRSFVASFFQIPLPTIVDDHQTKNAYIMADVMGAKVITEDELDSSSLTYIIDQVLGM
jgi:UDP-N-acetylglucosamine--N-acetylmuramyl-(pentapeptide) pyrophosphoryl-undecaprenol N-acetylglucosamine transferase